MSWHFLQGQEEESWEGTSLDGAPPALLNLMPTPGVCCSPASGTDCCQDSQYGTTCEPSTATIGEGELMLSAAASRAKTSARPARALGLTEREAAYGWKWPGSLAKYDPNSRLWRTRQCSLIEGLDEYSETWPRWGLMLDGECLELGTLAHATDETGSGFVPTILTSEATGPGLHGNGSHNFRTWFRENSTERRLPLHGEIMMLWPEGWASAGVPLGTGRFRAWRRLHGGF